jgi:hypothetical protein
LKGYTSCLGVFILFPENDKTLQEIAAQFEAEFAPLNEKFPEALRPLSAQFIQQVDQKIAAFHQGPIAPHSAEIQGIATDCDATQKKSEIGSRFEQYELPIQDAQTAIVKFQAYARALQASPESNDGCSALVTRVREWASKSEQIIDLLIAINRQLSWFVHGTPYGTSLDAPLNPYETAESQCEKYANGVQFEDLTRLAEKTLSVLEKVERPLLKLKASYDQEFAEWPVSDAGNIGIESTPDELKTKLAAARELGHQNRITTLQSFLRKCRDELRPELRQIFEDSQAVRLPTDEQISADQSSLSES